MWPLAKCSVFRRMFFRHGIFLLWPRRVFFIIWKACILFGVDTSEGHHTPQIPLPVPPPDKKGYQSAPSWILHPSAYSSRPDIEVLPGYGAKIEIRTPMHTWPTRHPQLACTAPHCLHFSEIHCLMLAQSWKFGVYCCSIGLTHPRPAPERLLKL